LFVIDEWLLYSCIYHYLYIFIFTFVIIIIKYFSRVLHIGHMTRIAVILMTDDRQSTKQTVY